MLKVFSVCETGLEPSVREAAGVVSMVETERNRNVLITTDQPYGLFNLLVS